MTSLEPVRSASFGEAKLAVAEQLCAKELEAQNWRLRCFQAEAQLRLQRLNRRGEQHPRWPQSAAQREQLLTSRASLKALDFTAIVQETLRDLVMTRTAVGHLQDLLEQTSQEVAELEEEASSKRARATSLTEGTPAEDAAFAAREQELAEEKDQTRGLADKLRDRFVLENDLAEQVALGQDQVERLQHEIQAFLPSQQQMQQEARQAQQESDKARSLAQRRREAETKLKEEVQQAERSAEEEQEAINARLEETRNELSETLASTAELGDQARKAQTSHNRQIKAVKTDGSALRDALADIGQEKEDMKAELSRLREIVGSAAAADQERQEHLAEAEANQEALAQQVVVAEEALSQAESAHAETSGTRADAIKEGLKDARLALSRAEQVAAEASEEAQAALKALEALRTERTRMKGETGPEAAKRRVQLTEALTKEQEQLSVEQEQLKARSRAEEEKLDWLRHRRDAQEYARSAAREAANSFRVAYSDMAKSSRASNTARPAGASPGAPVPEAANRTARKLSRHLEDFLRFMTEAVAVGEAKDSSQSPPKMVNLNLPAVLKEAYMGKFVQSDDGSSQAQQLDSSKEKLKVLKRELNDVGHRNETQSLTDELSELRKQIEEGEAQRREDQQKSEEAKQRLREGFKQAGYHRNEAQKQAVQRVQRELGTFEREVALLRRERDALKAEPPVVLAAGPPLESLAGRQGSKSHPKEREVEEVRNRNVSTMERNSSPMEEAGNTAAEDLGSNVRHGSPRPLHRPCDSPNRRPPGQSKPDAGKSSDEGRPDMNKSMEEGRPHVAKAAAEGRPDVSKGIEEGESSGKGLPEGLKPSQNDGAVADAATGAGSSEASRSVDESKQEDARVLEGGPSPSNKGSDKPSTLEDKATPAVTPVATPAASSTSRAVAAETPKAAPSLPAASTPSAVPGQAAPAASAASAASVVPVQAAPPAATAATSVVPVQAAPAASAASAVSVVPVQAAPPAATAATSVVPVQEMPVKLEASPSSPGRSSRALSTPWGDMEAARPESTPQSCSELASPSQLNSALAEIRRSEALSPTPPLSPNVSGQSLLRLEAAPSAPAESRLPCQVDISPPSPARIRPALAMSWADMEAAAMDPSPPSGAVSEPQSPGPSLSSPGVRTKGEASAYRGDARPEPALQCQWQPQPTTMPTPQPPPAMASVSSAADARAPTGCWEPLTAVPQHAVSPAAACGFRTLSPPMVASRQVQPLLPGYQVEALPLPYLQQQSDVRFRAPSPPPVYLAQVHSPVSMRSRSPSPHLVDQGSMAMNWTHIGHEASQFPRLPDFPVFATGPAPMQGTARRRPSDFVASPQAFSPRAPDTSPGFSSRPSDMSPGTGADSDLCSSSDVSRDVLGSPLSAGLVEDPWLGFPVRSPLRSPGRELRDGRPTHAGPLRRPVPSVTSPEWAEQAAEGQPVLPAPQLPSLEELFAQNMREQREERKLRQQRREPKESREPREVREPRKMTRTVLPSFEEPPSGFCGLAETPDDHFYGKPVKL